MPTTHASSNTNGSRPTSTSHTGRYRTEQPIDSLISAPLVAVTKANAMMFTGQTRFILENCFDKQDGRYVPVMLEMTFQTGTVMQDQQSENGFNISTQSMNFQIPLISLLPLNSLVIDSLKLNFGLDITSVYQGKSRSERLTEGELPGVLKHTTVMSGRITQTDKSSGGKQKMDSTPRKAHLKICIEVKAQALPKGIQSLLDIYSRSITPTAHPISNTNELSEK